MKKIMATVFIIAITAFAQTTVEITELDGSINGISDNGEIVCGFDGVQGQAFYWTLGTGKVLLGTSEAFGVSNDTVISGRFLDPNTLTNGNPTWVAAYYKNGQWNKVSGIPGIDPLDEGSYTHAYSINAQGTLMTGMVWRPGYKVEACFWSIPDTGIGLLGMVNNENSRADDISNDGSIIVGWNAAVGGSPDRTPYYWDPAPHFMGSLDSTWDGGECNGISPDGNILVGTTSALAFQYTMAGGMQAVTDPNAGNWGGWASDVSNNGVVVGHFDPAFFDYTAFIKFPGWQYAASLKSYLIDSLGVTGLTDYLFFYNRAISADGKVFVGEFASPTYPFGGAGFIIKINTPAAVEVVGNFPDEYSLEQNYPNPFNPSTTIRFTIPEASIVKLTVFNAIGEEISKLVNELYNAGTHEIVFSANNLSSGIYFVRIEAGSFVSARKITLMK